MFIWLFLLIAKVLSLPLPLHLLSTAVNATTGADDNGTTVDFPQEISPSDRANTTVLIDPSIFISLRENDWRDNHQKRMIIWSLESPHHPDFGRSYTRGRTSRMSGRSQMMSFLILGSVIGFILYTYLSHVFLTRKLNRQLKAAQLRELVHRSAIIMAGSAHHNQLNIAERRRSLINLFKGFKL